VETSRVFEEARIEAGVFLPGRKPDDTLEVSECGVLTIPPGLKPAAFYPKLSTTKEEARHFVIVQRNIEQKKEGGYHGHALFRLGKPDDELVEWVMYDPIPVSRAGENVWTGWKSAKPNRIDCWRVEENGHVDLFQVGVVTHDNGQTWRLPGEYRWRGQMFRDGKRVVGRPDDPKWGSFDVRRTILDNPDFRKLLEGAVLRPWAGKPEELDPPLDPVPGPDSARIDWYTLFGGQTGHGIAFIANCKACQTTDRDCGDWCRYCRNLPYGQCVAWVHGSEVMVDPLPPDGIKRLERNNLVSYAGVSVDEGRTKTRLLCVTKVQ